MCVNQRSKGTYVQYGETIRHFTKCVHEIKEIKDFIGLALNKASFTVFLISISIVLFAVCEYVYATI